MTREPNEDNEPWDLILDTNSKWYALHLNRLLRFKDLIFLFVRRDFVSIYKQTILGPIWFVLQPLLTAITYALIFGRLASVPTDGIPEILFYLSGIALWNYFSDTLQKTAETFTANANIFGKVYFPRLVVPLSIVISNLIKFSIQFAIFLAVWLYYYYTNDTIKPNKALLLLPLLVVLMGFLGLGMGLIISSITTKYRDLRFLITFGVQLLMYASPIIFPLSLVSQKFPQLKIYILANPITSIVETFRYAFMGLGEFNWNHLLYSIVFTVFIFIFGMIIFNKVEKSFMDTV